MYKFIYNMWVMKRTTAEQVQDFVDKGFISQEEADTILATPQCMNF